MITDRGIQLTAKYLADQIVNPLSFIALGAGNTPVEVDSWPASMPEPESFKSKTKLEFESVRVPISGSSVLVEGDAVYVSFDAVVPTSQRFEFSEIGIFSDMHDSLVRSTHDQILLSFSSNEPWQEDVSSLLVDVPYLGTDISSPVGIDPSFGGHANSTAFVADGASDVLNHSERKFASPRVFSESLLVNGASSGIQLSNALINLGKANASDTLSLAFVLTPKITPSSGTELTDVNSVTINIEFAESASSPVKAQFSKTIINGTADGEHDFSSSGHSIVSEACGNLINVKDVDWNAIGFVGINFTLDTNSTPDSDWYIIYDALRFDSSNTKNSAYGLLSYSHPGRSDPKE